jgi:hypothetical protein
MTTVAQLVLTSGDQRAVINLTPTALSAVAAKLTDNSEQAPAFDLLSEHADFEVRLAVAGMENLSNEAIGRLAADSSLSVVRQLLKSKAARPKLTPQQVLAIVERDPELAGFVAAIVEDFALDDERILSYLESHPDTHVRTKLAGNPFAGNTVLRRLAASDTDANVRQIAADILA